MEVELARRNLDEIKDLPLGAPDPGDKPAAEKARKARVGPLGSRRRGRLGTRPDEETRKGPGAEDESRPGPDPRTWPPTGPPARG